MLPTAPRRGCLSGSDLGPPRGAGRRVSSSPPGGGRSEPVQRAAPCETAAYSLICGRVARSALSKAAGSGFVVASIFLLLTSIIPRRHLQGFCVVPFALQPRGLGGLCSIDIESVARTRRPTHWRVTQLAHNTANAAHNTADRDQCAASDIGVSKTCLFTVCALRPRDKKNCAQCAR